MSVGRCRCLPPTSRSRGGPRAADFREQCPRRYCWYWHSLSFDWNLKPDDGCGVAMEHVGDSRLKRRAQEVGPWRQCCRATGNPQHPDYYEPREPHLEADGWPVNFFQVIGKAARRRGSSAQTGRARGSRSEVVVGEQSAAADRGDGRTFPCSALFSPRGC